MIRKGRLEDLDIAMDIFDEGRAHMRNEGNFNQWINGYPKREMIIDDIEKGNFYVVERDGEIVAAFTYILGEDPTYTYIEGKWLKDNPYGTVHRIGKREKVKGVMKEVKDYCLTKEGTIRIDTHHDNVTMRSVLEKLGFTYCGVIYVEDGSPRDAYIY
ncbi:MAG: GNAT family N-acetyltransferase [Clostridia bacterium]|nr:GNAT family N-acetyltransferase [Clostridia bacterium]